MIPKPAPKEKKKPKWLRQRRRQKRKSGRIVDRNFLDQVKALPCLLCGGVSDPDHITTRGAGGGDVKGNVWPVCRTHHIERGKIGLGTFIKKYPQLIVWLRDNGRNDIIERYL